MPEVREIEEQITRDVSNGKELLVRIQSTWLCAPRAFRYVERIIQEIGAIDSPTPRPSEGSILQCEDTYPDMRSCAEWFEVFTRKLDQWLEGETEAVPELGCATPVKHWLVRILRHKLLFSAEHEENFGKLAGKRKSGRSGTRIARSYAAVPADKPRR